MGNYFLDRQQSIQISVLSDLLLIHCSKKAQQTQTRKQSGKKMYLTINKDKLSKGAKQLTNKHTDRQDN